MLKVIGMTNDLLYLLLRASINASLSDRDAFIEKVSKIIEQQTHKDPEAARRLSDHIEQHFIIASVIHSPPG